jgi:hypothetical protein
MSSGCTLVNMLYSADAIHVTVRPSDLRNMVGRGGQGTQVLEAKNPLFPLHQYI